VAGRPRALENLEVNAAFWRGRRILVTGHTGFKGAWLVQWLHRMGAEIFGYALAPDTEPSLYREAGAAALLAHEQVADLRDLPRLKGFVDHARPEVLIHLAAQSLVRRSYAEPLETFTTNVIGTAHVLEAARSSPGLRAVVVVTTDKCYDNREQDQPYRETDPLGGADPYASSKAAAELVAAAYRRSFFQQGAAIATARAGNVIGGGDWSSDRLMTDVVHAFAAGRRVRLRHPQAVRPWQHVLDALHGYLVLAQALLERGHEFAQAWNFGPAEPDARPVAWVVEKAAALWGTDAGWEPDTGAHPHESTLLRLDASKARRLLGWKPVLGIGETLEWSIDWYRRHSADSRLAADLCQEQIGRFMERAAS
jgi:CDP-glucose 4,6-dehydratase